MQNEIKLLKDMSALLRHMLPLHYLTGCQIKKYDMKFLQISNFLSGLWFSHLLCSPLGISAPILLVWELFTHVN